MNKTYMAIGLAAILLSGCNDKAQEHAKTAAVTPKEEVVKQSVPTTPQNIYGASATQAPAKHEASHTAQSTMNTAHKAFVIKTVNGGGYTYAKINEDGTIYWIAGPQSDLKVGSTISFIEQMLMTDFQSKSLNKTFDQILFVSAIVSGDKTTQEDSSQKIQSMNDAHQNYTTKEAPALAIVSVAKNPDGYTVEELYAQQASLNDKTVQLNAQVVKVSKNIMGKDWIHLQDGTGQAGTNDMIATSVDSTVAVGDMVTTSGLVKTNVDLGYGYKFSIMIEEAKFTPIK